MHHESSIQTHLTSWTLDVNIALKTMRPKQSTVWEDVQCSDTLLRV